MNADAILRYELHLESGDWAQYLRAPQLVEAALAGADVVPAMPEGSLKKAILSTRFAGQKVETRRHVRRRPTGRNLFTRRYDLP